MSFTRKKAKGLSCFFTAWIVLALIFTWIPYEKTVKAENTSVDAARQNVVRIVVDNSANGSYSLGSGFVVGQDASCTYLVTNHHVVEANPQAVYIFFSIENHI